MITIVLIFTGIIQSYPHVLYETKVLALFYYFSASFEVNIALPPQELEKCRGGVCRIAWDIMAAILSLTLEGNLTTTMFEIV